MKLFMRYFEKAQKKGLLPEDADPRLLAHSINCYMKGILLEYLSAPEDFKINELGPKLINLFFVAYQR